MPNTAEIERIVREVLAEMAVAPAPCREGEAPVEPIATPLGPAPDAARQAPRPPETLAPRNRQELVLASRLVTLSDVADRLTGVRRLVVRPGTVVTPAVKEELAKRNIRVDVIAAKNDAAGLLRLVIVATRIKIDPQPFAAALQSEGAEVELIISKCIIEATDRLAAEAALPNTLGLLLTPHDAESLCLANRLPGVRAIAGREASQVAADAAAVGANVLVVNPTKIGGFAIRQILGEFCRGGVRACPATLNERLS
jgi:hypothetical protein